jgi:hypothetical protein
MTAVAPCCPACGSGKVKTYLLRGGVPIQQNLIIPIREEAVFVRPFRYVEKGQ